jgi:tRNA pseudouridine65 synthase
MSQFKILYQDHPESPRLLAIEKPAGFYVHPPQGAEFDISPAFNCMRILKRQLGGAWVQPVHRLDRKTSGVLLFALDAEMASAVSGQFAARETEKVYFALVRGWVESARTIETHGGEWGDGAVTEVEPVIRAEFPWAIGRYPTARYTLLRILPRTGKTHQIRRHLAGISHPIIGDNKYGDRNHNRYFREHESEPQLFLKAFRLGFQHPESGEGVRIQCHWGGAWHRLFDRIGVCPWEGPRDTSRS